MKTRIYSGFPGIGKSHIYESHKFDSSQIILDSDSSKFDKTLFPGNYIKHIKNNIDKVSIIMVSSHDVVREALVKENIDFILVYPDRSLKEIYKERYIKRGSPKAFIDLLEKKWDDWIDELENQEGCEKIVLKKGQYLSDVIF